MDGAADESLRQELNGANRLAEFRLQKVIELQEEVQRLRRLVLDSQGRSAKTRKTVFSGRRDGSSSGTTRCLRNGKSLSSSLLTFSRAAATPTPSPRQGGRRTFRTPSPLPHPPTTATAATVLSPFVATGGRNVASPIPRLSSAMSASVKRDGNCGGGVSRRFFYVKGRTTNPQSSTRVQQPTITPATTTAVRSRSATRPFIKLHTGVKLCGPKTFLQRLPSPPSSSVDKAIYGTSASDAFVASSDNSSSFYDVTAAQPRWQSTRLYSSVVIRREYESVQDALAMLRGILLRADRSMLSSLTALSNRRGVDHVFPAAIAEFKQCLLRGHPSLSGKLHEGEAWRIDEEERDTLEMVVIPGMIGKLRDIIITHDYTRSVYQSVLNNDEGAVSIKLAKAFHEFYANMHILLALSQCLFTDR